MNYQSKWLKWDDSQFGFGQFYIQSEFNPNKSKNSIWDKSEYFMSGPEGVQTIQNWNINWLKTENSEYSKSRGI